jgi:hypothetical protein
MGTVHKPKLLILPQEVSPTNTKPIAATSLYYLPGVPPDRLPSCPPLYLIVSVPLCPARPAMIGQPKAYLWEEVTPIRDLCG